MSRLLSLCALVAFVCPGSGQEKQSPAVLAFFESNVRPVLANRCFECHGPKKHKGDLRVDSLASLLEGGKSGPALQPGKPDESLLIQAIRHGENLQMPPRMKLPAKEIADLTAWVKMGAPWPDARPVAARTTTVEGDVSFSKEKIEHWSFRPVRQPQLSDVKHTAWAQSPIDRFVLARLEEKGLQPAPPASPRVLLRRLYFDLLGLPPTADEMHAFLQDCGEGQTPSRDAVARVVDRLLASPHYGERWARHWLDVVRYADSNGMDENLVYGNAWRYRDYVIDAFNSDKPYDRFVRDQLAGDLLSAAPVTRFVHTTIGVEPMQRPDPTPTGLIATGFLCIGPKMLADDDPVKMEMDIIDEQVDTLGRAFLGMTLGCVRCHDHKFDPFSQADYYALAGIFKSTKTMDNFRVVARWHERPLVADHAQRLHDINKQIAQLKERINRRRQRKDDSGDDERSLADLEKEKRLLPEAMAVDEGKPTSMRVHLRGNHLTLGKEVPRRFPTLFASLQQPRIEPNESGRLQLAEWITQPAHPLTSRVMVNRLWYWHFGAGLVRSVDNFGLLGDKPSHPELLDWLASRFVESGWSMKALHRMIVLSSTYQMSSAYDERAYQVDPDNVLLWRHSRRRLDAEALRDSLLFLGGSLDPAMGGTLFTGENRKYVPGYPNSSYDRYDSRRRSIYLPVVRSNLYDMFQAFDFADPSFSSGERATTTVAPQALFLMNGKIVHEQIRAWTNKLLADRALTPPARIARIYEQALGRVASDGEVARGLDFVRRLEAQLAAQKTADASSQAWQSLCRVIVASNEFIYLE